MNDSAHRAPPYLKVTGGRLIPDWSRQRADEYRPIPRGSVHRSPSIWLTAWIDPRFAKKTDSRGVRLYDRLMESLLNIGLVSSVGFKVVPYQHAQFRFHCSGKSSIAWKSWSWNNYEGNYWSTLFAVFPRNRQPIMRAGLPRVDVYSGWIGKWQYGSNPHQPDTAIRVPWHGAITHGLGWFPEQSRSAPNYAMRNPNMSGTISYPFAHRRTKGCAGYDVHEISQWIRIARLGDRIPEQPHGGPWLRRFS